MRTLTTLLEWALTLSERKNNEDRKYDVKGMFVIRLIPGGAEPDLIAIKKAIEELITERPWHSEKLRWQTQEEADEYILDDGEIFDHQFPEPAWQVICFQLCHKHHYIHKGQVYGYEHFLEHIAEELAKRLPHLATEVRSIINVRAGTSFPT